MNVYKYLLQITIVLLLTGFARSETPAIGNIEIVPRPVSMKRLAGSFRLDNETQILTLDNESRRIAGLFSDSLLAYHGFHLKFAEAKPKSGNYIEFTQVGSQDLPGDGYRLEVGPKNVRITGRSAGLFYGIQSLMQLLPS